MAECTHSSYGMQFKDGMPINIEVMPAGPEKKPFTMTNYCNSNYFDLYINGVLTRTGEKIMELCDFDIIKPKKQFVNCFVHGSISEALMNGTCRQCKEEEVAKKENEEYEKIITQKKRDSGIPERYLSFRLDDYPVHNEKQATLIKTLSAYEFGSKDIVLLGKTGTGKTRLGCSLMDRAIRKSVSCYYVPFYHLPKLQIREPKQFDKMMRTQLLVIDEFGMSATDYKNNILGEIWNDRNGMGKQTMLISNYSADQIRPGYDSKTKDTTGVSDALYSRMKENCVYFACDWNDYRIKGDK